MSLRPSRSAVVVVAALLAAGGTLSAPDAADAQTAEEVRRRAEEALGRPISQEEILRRLRSSGLTAGEVRSRLARRGYDPDAADPWLRALESEEGRVPEGTSAVPILSVLSAGDEGREEPAIGQVPAGEGGPAARGAGGGGSAPEVFGRALFRRATSQFRPVTTGPVPPDYRLGPDDHLRLVLTGGVEQAYDLEVSREGWIVIPDVGQVFVNGKTLEALESDLRSQLSRVYSSVADGSTRFDVSVGELRTSQVYVIGEVEQPAAYTVSSLATALTALYHAGGPTPNGSFRSVRVNRGGETVATVDLYDYLLGGRADQDVRLRQGDVVFVPLAGAQVTLAGPVSRPGIYELEEGETLRDALRYAGGVEPTAEIRRVQIRRILPPEERAPGRDRAVLDVPVGSLDAGGGPGPSEERIALRDGDRITVFAVLDDVRNAVEVSGGVWRPGTYGVGDDTRLWDVIEKAGGLLPDAYEGRAQIQRLRPDHTRRMIGASLARGPEGRPEANPRIRGMDQVYVYARRELREGRAVSIGGWVRKPGTYPYVDGMTVEDLVLKAGGVRTGAFTGSAEVSRVVISQSRTDTLTRRYEVPLEVEGGAASVAGADDNDGERAGSGPRAGGVVRSDFPLRNLDAVYIRKAPGFEPQRTVTVTGEVLYEGPYSIRTRDERLTDVIGRAGGLTAEAYAPGFQLWRRSGRVHADDASLSAAEISAEGAGVGPGASGGGAGRRVRVGIDFDAARDDPASPANVLVEPGDSIHVPRYDATVTVRGAVGMETKVLFREGAGLGHYIDRAGGYAEDAAEELTRVEYAGGDVETKGDGFLFFGGGVSDPDPGSTIFVPRKLDSDEGISVESVVGIVSSVASAAATIAIALTR